MILSSTKRIHKAVGGHLPQAHTALVTPQWTARPDVALFPLTVCIGTLCGPRSKGDGREGSFAVDAAKVLLEGTADVVAVAHQVHGAVVRRMERPANCPVAVSEPFLLDARECDGLWTSERGLALVIRTADCAPVALWDDAGMCICVVHSGWRGTLANITGEAIAQLNSQGIRSERLNLWIGPCIGKENYEVGDEVRDAFAQRWGQWSECWSGPTLDIPGLIAHQAEEGGIPRERVAHSGLCTYEKKGLLPSHRREGVGRSKTLYTLASLKENQQ